jgi:hypothetical protein
MSFKTPDKPTVAKTGSSSVRKAKVAALPRQHVEQIENCLTNGAYARAFRGLSTMLAGSYKPGRNLYAIIWHWMLLAKVGRECFAMLRSRCAVGPFGRAPVLRGTEAAAGVVSSPGRRW